MRFQPEHIGKVNGDKLVRELQRWQDELLDDTIEDEIIYSTLETVIEMIVND